MVPSPKVTLFVQCLVDSVFPHVADAMVQVFKSLGIELECPSDQTCCGQPAFNSGYHNAARKAATHFIETFEQAEVIVCPSGSCTDMVRHHFATLFKDDPIWAQRAANLADEHLNSANIWWMCLASLTWGRAITARSPITIHVICSGI